MERNDSHHLFDPIFLLQLYFEDLQNKLHRNSLLIHQENLLCAQLIQILKYEGNLFLKQTRLDSILKRNQFRFLLIILEEFLQSNISKVFSQIKKLFLKQQNQLDHETNQGSFIHMDQNLHETKISHKLYFLQNILSELCQFLKFKICKELLDLLEFKCLKIRICLIQLIDKLPFQISDL